MKWYLAIPLTLLIWAAVVTAVQVNATSGKVFAGFVTAISAIWVAAKSSSFGWGLFVFLFWPIGFPFFLIAQYKRLPRVTASTGQDVSA
jgi:hypothetical protein